MKPNLQKSVFCNLIINNQSWSIYRSKRFLGRPHSRRFLREGLASRVLRLQLFRSLFEQLYKERCSHFFRSSCLLAPPTKCSFSRIRGLEGKIQRKKRYVTEHEEVCATDLHLQCCFPPLCRYSSYVHRLHSQYSEYLRWSD